MVSNERPFKVLCRLTRELGWPKLRRHRHSFKSGLGARNALVVTWYESGEATGAESDLFLKVIHSPADQHDTQDFEAAVFAIRYRICTPWRRFKLHFNQRKHATELSQLRPWLDRANFDSLEARNKFRNLHSECTGYSWRKIRAVGLPNCDYLQLNEIISEDGK